jgi:hypothetical protein
MENGIYKITVESSGSGGGLGIALVKSDRIFGCNEENWYTGKFESNSGDPIRATLHIDRHAEPRGCSVLSCTLRLSGTATGSSFDLTGLVSGYTNDEFRVRGTRLGDIP